MIHILVFMLSVLAHDFHVTYGRMAVEENVVAIQLRVFQDDFNKGLQNAGAPADFRLGPTAASDSTAMAYISRRLHVVAAGDTLQMRLSSSGEDLSGQEPMWWFLLESTAPRMISSLTMDNVLLFETFDDQKNIVQIQHFPSEKTWSLYFAGDSDTFTVDLD